MPSLPEIRLQTTNRLSELEGRNKAQLEVLARFIESVTAQARAEIDEKLQALITSQVEERPAPTMSPKAKQKAPSPPEDTNDKESECSVGLKGTRLEGLGLEYMDENLMGQLASAELLTREQELTLMKRIDVYRRRWRMLVLSTQIGLKTAVGLLEGIQKKDLNSTGVLSFTGDGDPKKRKKDLEANIKPTIMNATALIEQIPKMIDRHRDPETTPEEREEMAQGIKKLSRQAVAVIEECPIQGKYLQVWMNEMISDGEKSDKLNLYIREKGPEAEKALLVSHQLEEKYGESLREGEDGNRSSFAKRLHFMRKYFDLYQQAKNELCAGNLRLVFWQAKKFQNKGMPLLDLVQEGNIGLMKAAEDVNWRLGLKFSTYATWWIRSALGRAIDDKVRTVRLPANVGLEVNKLRKAEEEIRQREQRKATDEELASALGISEKKVRNLKKANKANVSLNSPLGHDGDGELMDTVAAQSEEADRESNQEQAMKEMIASGLGGLTFRELQVIKLRFGIGDGYEYGLAEVGKVFKVSRERIRQIEAKALVKLRLAWREKYAQLDTEE